MIRKVLTNSAQFLALFQFILFYFILFHLLSFHLILFSIIVLISFTQNDIEINEKLTTP